MDHPVAIVLYAVFVWWFSTGLVLWLNRRQPRTFFWSLIGGTALLGAALMGILWSRESTGVLSIYCAFSCGLVAWAWQELTFYLGYVTGPRQRRCSEGCAGWKHFGHALGVSLYHELSIIMTALVLAAMVWDAPNKIALWTFLLVWLMHQSARLNVFLGVRNVSEDWVPAHLPFLKSFLRQRPMNALFPISLLLASGLLIWLIQRIGDAPPGSYEAIGGWFLAAFTALAILEHVFLVLPLPLTALWRLWGATGLDANDHSGRSQTASGAQTNEETGPHRSRTAHDTPPAPLGGLP